MVNRSPVQVTELSRAFIKPDYYLDKDAAHDVLKNKTMFKLIDTNSGDRIDFWMLNDDI